MKLNAKGKGESEIRRLFSLIEKTINSDYVPYTGALSNLDMGAFNITTTGEITGSEIISTITTGTAPLTISSTTLVSNLNVDLLDGMHASEFLWLDQTAVQTIINGVPLMTTAVDPYGSGDQLVNMDYVLSGEWLLPPIIEW
jgi:hypothetical protein